MKSTSKVITGFLILMFAISTLSLVPIDANALSETTIVDTIFDTESDIVLDDAAIDRILNTAKLYSRSSEDDTAIWWLEMIKNVVCSAYASDKWFKRAHYNGCMDSM